MPGFSFVPFNQLDRVADAVTERTGGNPLCCAAACAVIDTLAASDLVPDVPRKGNRLVTKLAEAKLPLVRELRGMGLMIEIDCRVRIKNAMLALLERGIITLPTGPTVLRLLPPLTITDDELDELADALINVLGDASAAPG